MSKDLNYSKIEKIQSEIGNSTISNVYNFGLNGTDDKENNFTANSRKGKEDRDHHKTAVITHFKNQALIQEVLNTDLAQVEKVRKMRKIQSNLPAENNHSLKFLK